MKLFKTQKLFFKIIFLFIVSTHVSVALAERIKDLSMVQGMRDNQLIGYGLVVGLNGTGDKVNQVAYTEQSLKNMLSQLGIVVPPGVKLKP